VSSVSSPELIRERLARIRAEVGPGVTVVAATKYVDVDEMALLVEAGIDVAGENRAQDLERKHAVYGDAFRWHFIGPLQSNKAKVVNRICELVHSVDTESTLRRLEIPALLQVNLAGEATKAGVAPDAVEALLAHGRVVGLSTMPPATDDPERSRPIFEELRQLARRHGLAELSMGTSQDYRVAAQAGATYVRVGSSLLRG
jgi:PLP dependent protein